MGLYASQLSVRGAAQQAVAQQHSQCFSREPAFVSSSIDGWVTVFTRMLDTLDEGIGDSYAAKICCGCRTEGLVFSVMASDYFSCRAISASGVRLAQLDLHMNGGTELDSDEVLRSCERIAAVGGNQNVSARLVEIVQRDDLLADFKFYDFARTLKIPYSGLSYGVLCNEADDLDEDFFPKWNEVVHVG